MKERPKRGYSPTIDDIRQYNIKRFKLLEDMDSLNLSSRPPSPIPTPQPPYNSSTSDKNREFIGNIDEFLIHNQDDNDIIESSKQITDLLTVDPDHLIIPDHIINKNIKLSVYDSQVSLDRLKSKREFMKKYGITSMNNNNDNNDQVISKEEVFYDFAMLKFWGLIKYINPYLFVYHVWERWYFNVFKLNEFSEMSNNNNTTNDDIMIDDEYDDSIGNVEDTVYKPKVRNNYGGYYYDVSTDDSGFIEEKQQEEEEEDDDDKMDLD